MTIKTFKDGTRFCIVFDGLENMPSQEKMIQSILSSVMSQPIEHISSVEADPIIPEEECPPELPNPVFLVGDYEGLSAREVAQKGNRGVWYLNQQLGSGTGDAELDADILEVLTEIVKKNFGSVEDPDAFTVGLSDKQIDTIFALYGNAFAKEIINNICEEYGTNWASFMTSDVNTKKLCLPEIIGFYRK